MPIKLFGLSIEIKRTINEPPETGRRYFHRDHDEKDMVNYVTVREIKDGTVYYTKIYKPAYRMDPAQDTATIQEFNRYYELMR